MKPVIYDYGLRPITVSTPQIYPLTVKVTWWSVNNSVKEQIKIFFTYDPGLNVEKKLKCAPIK